MTTRRQGRPKATDATNQGGTTASEEKEQTENGGTSGEKPPETKEAKGEEKVSDDKDAEIEKLKNKLKEAKAGKVVDVIVESGSKSKLRPSQQKKLTHTVYVAKKRGDEWGNNQEREMSEQAYNAIAKDISLKVTLPKNSRLVEPEIKGCKDC